MKAQARSKRTPPLLAELFSIENVRIGVKARDWEDVVDQAGGLLVLTGGVEPRYVAAMKTSIRENGPYVVLVPGIALLHARPEEGALKECLCLLRLADPIPFGNAANDPVDLTIAFAAADSSVHIGIISRIAHLLGDQSMLARIRSANTPEALLEALHG